MKSINQAPSEKPNNSIDPLESILTNFKSLLFSIEELTTLPAFTEKLPDPPVCEKCKKPDSRELPCLHRVCEKCLEEKISPDFVVTCPVCNNNFNYVADAGGFFICNWEDKQSKSGQTLTEIRIFGDNDMLLNYKFAQDFANDPKYTKIDNGEITLPRYFEVFKKDNFTTSDVATSYKKKVLICSFPKYPVCPKLATNSEYKATPDTLQILSICKSARLHLPNKEIVADQNGRSRQPIVAVPGSFLPDRTINCNFGSNVALVKRLLQKLYPRDTPTTDSLIHVKTPEKALPAGVSFPGSPIIEVTSSDNRISDQLPPEPPLPLTCQNSSRFSYKSLTSALYQAPCNEFEERIMKTQKYKDFTNPIFTINNELLQQAKEIADSLTTKNAGVPSDPLPKSDDFSFDLYQQVKCKKYRYCVNCCPDARKDKIVYNRAVWEMIEQEREKLATHKCLTCKEYLCPTCANLHKMKHMDHKYQFKVDRKDYYSIRRARQEDVIKTMNDLIKEKVRQVLEKVNKDVSTHLIECVNIADGKYSGNS